MRRTEVVRIVVVSFAVLAAELGHAADGSAQSQVPPKGEGTVTVTYQNYYHTGHFDRLGKKNKNGATHTKAVIGQIDFGITDTIGLNVTLPFIASKYTGPRSYFVEGILTTPGPLDDGSYHEAFQDVRAEIRRMFLMGSVAAAPFVAVSLPTHHYETAGEAVPGRHRRELQLGASATWELDRVLPGTYVHGRYAYAALERINAFPHTRSNLDVEAGHDITSRVAVRGLLGGQIAHKRPLLAELIPDWVNHDRFINSSYLNVGGGVSLSLKSTTEIYALWDATVRGSRGAHVARTLAIGVSRSFGSGLHGLGP